MRPIEVNIILQDANIEKAVAAGANHCFLNTGQSCNAPTRMLVHSSQYDEAVEKDSIHFFLNGVNTENGLP